MGQVSLGFLLFLKEITHSSHSFSIMRSLSDLINFVKNCLRRIYNRQFLTFLFFLLLSTSFWVFQKLNDTYEREFAIRVRLVDVPSNVDITTGPPDYLHVTLRDKGVTLLRYRFARNFPSINIHWKDVEGSRGHYIIRTRDLLKSFTASLDGTQLVGYRPDNIDIYYNYYSKGRMFDVKFQGVVEADSAFTWIDTQIAQSRVMVYGPQHVLDTMRFARLMPVRLKGVRDTLIVRCKFQKIPGVKYVALDKNKTVLSSSRVTIITDRMVDGAVDVPVQGVNFPGTKTLITNPSKVRVEYQVGLRDHNKITASSFVIVARYEDLLNLPGNTFTARPRSTPPGVRRVRVRPEEVEFIIQDSSGESE